MIDAPKPTRIEEENIGKKCSILRGEFAGNPGEIVSYKSSIYQVKVLDSDGQPVKHKGIDVIIDRMPTEIFIFKDGANSIGALTSAGVAGELAKEDAWEINGTGWKDEDTSSEVGVLDLQAIKTRAENWKVPMGVSETVKEDLLSLVAELEAARLEIVGYQVDNGKLQKYQFEEQSTLDNLRRQVASLIAANATLDEKAVNAQSAAASHLAANTKLNEKLIEAKQEIERLEKEQKDDTELINNLEAERDELKRELEAQKPHPADVEAMRMVEYERDEARRELEISRKQVQILARKMRRDKQQPVEIKTLVQALDEWSIKASDDELAKYLNEGWTIMNFAASSFHDQSERDIVDRRVITLSRPIKTSPQPPKRETATEAPIVVTGEVIPVSIPVPATPAYAAPFNKAAMDAEVMANANAAVLAFRATRQNVPTPSFMLKSGV